ncbi:hypothetical protein H6F86_09980 [Phormidium sp. FACHB-592]|uniref:Pyridoxamine 5'-phosphate oxidase family protein n=1 Tax=Stenomitos frigidus AS-A4 TaxID=2933935 RepID=A0ABV0KRW6_9CYAN|nr:hypothetical protein [Leptolyngbya sp. FACHB-321]MBD2074212.1 hypothetical protein [Phormidium sp. FACHB-592]
MHNPLHWRSVMVNGQVERLTDPQALDETRQLFLHTWNLCASVACSTKLNQL